MSGKEHDEFLVSVSVVVMNGNGHVLVGQRLREGHVYYGYWEIPGGKLEFKDKSLDKAAAREVWEETGLRVSNLKLIGVKYYPKTLTNVYAGVGVGFITTEYTGTVQNLESSNLEFVPIEKALKLKLLPWARYFLKNTPTKGS